MKRSVPIIALVLALGLPVGTARADDGPWRATWGAGMSSMGEEDALAVLMQSYVRLTFPDLQAHDRTLRQIVRTSVGGTGVRIRISNALGDGPLVVGRVAVAVRREGPAVVPGTTRVVRFGGREEVTLAAGTDLTSDPVELDVDPEQELAVSTFIRSSPPSPTLHFLSLTDSTTTLPGAGDHTTDTGGEAFGRSYRHWPWLSGVDVHAPQETGMVVAFGDSNTDGAYVSNFATETKDKSWPSRLAARLRRAPASRYARAVINMGISANTVTTPLPAWTGPPAVDRFDREALDRPGVTHILLFEGTNDLGEGTPVDQITAALSQLIDRAHARGIRVIGATIPPRADTDPPLGSWSAEKEPSRKALNAWIRSYPGYDGLADFDHALADPRQPDRLRSEYDSGDHLHPGPKGRQAMADAIDLGMLTCTPDPSITLPRRGIIIGRHRVSVRGSATPGYCRSHGLDRITVTVAKLDAPRRCRFLTARGRLLPARACSRPILLSARGTTAWHLHTKATLPPGRYLVRASVRAGDASAATERTLRAPRARP